MIAVGQIKSAPQTGWGWRSAWIGLVVVLAGWGCQACGSPGSGDSAVVARVGALEIIHPFLPDPASPSVAAIYLTVRNNGSVADQLVSATTSSAVMAMLMTEKSNGDADSMAPLLGLNIPAHGQASLSPGRNHLMLEYPRHSFKVGDSVPVVLHFARSGPVQVTVPVVPLEQILGS
jgi:periplasmic copper chaperone A